MKISDEMRAKRQAVLDKFYGGERKAWMHDFDILTGHCKNCSQWIGDALESPYSRLCRVITPDEVKLFRDYDFH